MPDVSRRADAIALGDHVAGAPFALAALGGYTQLELDLVKPHARTRVPSNVAVRNSTADTDDHGQTFVDKRKVTLSAPLNKLG